jgi:hypothetical protein
MPRFIIIVMAALAAAFLVAIIINMMSVAENAPFLLAW